jgi:hypothetical protein
MRFRLAVLLAFGLTFAACGAAEPDRFSLRTPGAHTGDPVAPTPVPTPVPSSTPQPKPPKATKRKPVTKAERRIVRGWSDALRGGHVRAAARYFSIPSLVSNNTPGAVALVTADDVKAFNRALPCGAKLVRMRRGTDHFVVGVFRLTERPGAGSCGTGTGEMAAVAFLIRDDHITQWVRADQEIDPAPSPTPAPSRTPDGITGPPDSA